VVVLVLVQASAWKVSVMRQSVRVIFLCFLSHLSPDPPAWLQCTQWCPSARIHGSGLASRHSTFSLLWSDSAKSQRCLARDPSARPRSQCIDTEGTLSTQGTQHCGCRGVSSPAGIRRSTALGKVLGPRRWEVKDHPSRPPRH
jgi:hypothetical protein